MTSAFADAVQAFGGEAVMTRSDHRSGTERVAEVALARGDAEIIVNVQGDEPLIEPAAIDAAVAAIQDDPEVTVATLAVPITKPADIMDPNIVKVVLDFDGNALYFSRAPIPWVRDRGGPVHAQHLKHLGLYAFRRAALLDFPTFPQGDLERIEQLEQLRWLENGYASASPKPNTIRSAWTCPKTSPASSSCWRRARTASVFFGIRFRLPRYFSLRELQYSLHVACQLIGAVQILVGASQAPSHMGDVRSLRTR